MTQAFFNIDTLVNDDLAVADVPVVFNEDAEPIAGFKVVGKNSARYQEAQRAIEILSIKRAVIKKQQIDAKTDEGAGQFVDINKENQIRLATAAVVSIYGFRSGDTDLKATPEVLANLFNKRPTWLAKVITAIEAETGFLPA
ncbi:hypothetical protein H8L32_23020 [Undibacterium sp. CY18W]|uniref:Phage protein n=1 Tax=Undibacterium hunanense TaxID=2762292 RepID=A0ABR6ZXG9_9BURK|nr:hypothetical protein [Undibacterium hunanense]MBC3920354.1 hypothetical protein [Undibacterium hunanense]